MKLKQHGTTQSCQFCAFTCIVESIQHRGWPQCVVPEHIHTLPMEGHWKFWGGRGSLRPKVLKECVDLNWNLQWGSFKSKNPCCEGGGGYGYSLEHHNTCTFWEQGWVYMYTWRGITKKEDEMPYLLWYIHKHGSLAILSPVEQHKIDKLYTS